MRQEFGMVSVLDPDDRGFHRISVGLDGRVLLSPDHARALAKDLLAAAQAVEPSDKPRIALENALAKEDEFSDVGIIALLKDTSVGRGWWASSEPPPAVLAYMRRLMYSGVQINEQ